MREAENIVEIKGKLSEVNLKEGEKDGRRYITGSIIIKVTQEISGKMVSMDLPVSVMAGQLTKAGTENPAYQSASKVMNEMKSIAACKNPEEADNVSITKGVLGENIFLGQQKTLVVDTRIRASFINKINGEFTPTATFTNVIIIAAINEEINKEGQPTGRLLITGILPQYGDKVDIVNYIVESPPAIKHITTYWSKGDTVKVFGRINYSTRTIETEEAVGFGEPIKHTRIESIKELIVTSGSEEPYPEDSAYKMDEVSAALVDRKSRIAQIESGNASKKAAPAKDASLYGF
jgi:hypothetical protein